MTSFSEGMADVVAVAEAALDEAIELADFLAELVELLEAGQYLEPQTLDVHPFAWREDAEGGLVVVGAVPGIDLAVWEQVNRRLAARVLEHWQREASARWPERRPRVGWRIFTGIEEWPQGRGFVLALFFDDQDPTGFELGLPADPAPLTPDERRRATGVQAG